MHKKNNINVFSLLIIFGLLCIMLLSGCYQGPPERPTPEAHPEKDTYYCDELKMSIDFTEFNRSYSKDNYSVKCVTVYGDDDSDKTDYYLELQGSMFFMEETEPVVIEPETEPTYFPMYMCGEYSYTNGVFSLIPQDDSKAYTFTLMEEASIPPLSS